MTGMLISSIEHLGKIFKVFNSYADPNKSNVQVSVFCSTEIVPFQNLKKCLEIQGRAMGFSLAIGHLSFFIVGYIWSCTRIRKGRISMTVLIQKIGEIEWYNNESIILMGDFNFVENPDLDRCRRYCNIRLTDKSV